MAKLEDVKHADAVIAAVAHADIKGMDMAALSKITGANTPFMDVKSIFNRDLLEESGFIVWRL